MTFVEFFYVLGGWISRWFQLHRAFPRYLFIFWFCMWQMWGRILWGGEWRKSLRCWEVEGGGRQNRFSEEGRKVMARLNGLLVETEARPQVWSTQTSRWEEEGLHGRCRDVSSRKDCLMARLWSAQSCRTVDFSWVHPIFRTSLRSPWGGLGKRLSEVVVQGPRHFQASPTNPGQPWALLAPGGLAENARSALKSGSSDRVSLPSFRGFISSATLPL